MQIRRIFRTFYSKNFWNAVSHYMAIHMRQLQLNGTVHSAHYVWLVSVNSP